MKAKCTNYSSCLLAYRGEPIEIADGAPMVCPECGKACDKFTGSAGGAGGGFVKIAIGLIGLALVGAGGFFFWLKKPAEKPAPVAPAATAPAITPSNATAPSTTASATAPAANEPAAAPVPETVVAAENVDLDLNKEENQKVRAEVLKRVDVIPNISQTNRDRLYNSVERARSMGLVLTIPFASGKTALTPGDAQALKNAIGVPQITKLRDDPTAVFVILGYADPKGDAKKNLEVSQVRADAVLAIMRDDIKVANVMHSVAMGGSKLLDGKKLEKNRVVEVWAVLP